MSRMKPDYLERVDRFVDRVLDVVNALATKRVFMRILDQLVGSATSVGANLSEADEAMSDKDFQKCVAISLKELNETRYWLRLVQRRGCIKAHLLSALCEEADEHKKILGTILARMKKTGKKD